MNIFDIVSAWDAEPIQDTGSNRLKTRVIAGKVYQIPVLDYRKRSRMGLSILGQAENFAPLLQTGESLLKSGVENTEDLDESEQVSIAMSFIPQVAAKLANGDFFDLIDGIARIASVDLAESVSAKFEPLAQDHIAEKVFGEDITLLLPIAMTVAEVNLTGFFDKIRAVFQSSPSRTEKLETS